MLALCAVHDISRLGARLPAGGGAGAVMAARPDNQTSGFGIEALARAVALS